MADFSNDPGSAGTPQVTFLGKLIIVLFMLGCLAGGFYLLRGRLAAPAGSTPAPADTTAGNTAAPPATGTKPEVEINIAYGTEKERWLKWAAGQFAQTKDGARIRVNLLPLGSLEGAQAALAGEKKIHVWTPASALYKDTFVQDWQGRYNTQAILREEPLALSPMVFVMWAERYEAFAKKYGTINFQSVSQALAEPTGWEAIAQKPDWGLFKFGHTHPNESNSGLMTLVLMLYDFSKKNRGLTAADVTGAPFQQWMGNFERGVSGLSNSTGNMMKEMILKGPSSFDGLCVYENVAIDYLKNAEGRWGELHVAYPERNMWNDNPYYILNAEWSSPAQRAAAGAFLDFLLTVPIQKESLVHGFRPANTDVAVRFPESPFVAYARYGLRVDPPVTAQPVGGEVITNLLQSWQRTRGAR